MSNVKATFIPNVWVKCIFKKKICLGRTFLEKSEQLISLISESGDIAQVSFSQVRSLVILKILTVQDFERENSIKKAFDKSGSNNLSFSLAQAQIKSLMS